MSTDYYLYCEEHNVDICPLNVESRGEMHDFLHDHVFCHVYIEDSDTRIDRLMREEDEKKKRPLTIVEWAYKSTRELKS